MLVEHGDGLVVSRDLPKLGYKGVESCELSFTEYRAPANAVLGGTPGRGFAQMMKGLEIGRIQVASRAVGVAQAAFDDALKYALHIRQGLVVPESDHAIPLPGEKCRPLGVGSLLQPMLSAVELDDKLVSVQQKSAITQPRPELSLHVRLGSAQTTRVVTWPLADLPPHPALSPDGGEGGENPLRSGEDGGERIPLPFGERVG